MGGNVTAAHEALMAELQRDTDVLMRRFEQAEKVLAGKIGEATTDAVGKAFPASRLKSESVPIEC
jgi:hypothetical protein